MKNLTNYFLAAFIIVCFTFGTAISNADVSIFMRTPKTVKAGDSYRVDITINKDGLKGFSKFETQIPEGFNITPINSNSSTFILKNSVAKFIWIEMPKDESLQISYYVKVPEDYYGDSRINGAFHYIDNNEKYSQRFCSLLNIYNDNPEIVKIKKAREVLSSNTINENLFAINENVNFCVQLAAFSKKIPANVLSEMFEDSYRIKEVFENNLYKYYVGEFNTLQGALDFKEYCGINDAFIVAYHRNKRIPINEAMLIIVKEK